MKQLLRTTIFLFVLTIASGAYAAVIELRDDGKLDAVRGIDLDGVLYDVSFRAGAFDSTFSGYWLFNGDQMTAELASRELYAVIEGTVFDLSASSVGGCLDFARCDILTPFEVVANAVFDQVFSAAIINYSVLAPGIVTGEDGFDVRQFPVNLERDDVTWARWTLATVPEPSTFALLAAGLLAFGLTARRRRVS